MTSIPQQGRPCSQPTWEAGDPTKDSSTPLGVRTLEIWPAWQERVRRTLGRFRRLSFTEAFQSVDETGQADHQPFVTLMEARSMMSPTQGQPHPTHQTMESHVVTSPHCDQTLSVLNLVLLAWDGKALGRCAGWCEQPPWPAIKCCSTFFWCDNQNCYQTRLQGPWAQWHSLCRAFIPTAHLEVIQGTVEQVKHPTEMPSTKSKLWETM